MEMTKVIADLKNLHRAYEGTGNGGCHQDCILVEAIQLLERIEKCIQKTSDAAFFCEKNAEIYRAKAEEFDKRGDHENAQRLAEFSATYWGEALGLNKVIEIMNKER